MDRYLTLFLVASVLCGCQLRRQRDTQSYQTVAKDPRRDEALARREAARAKSLLESGELAEAEKALKAALAADLFHGPAHNNLGIVYFRQSKFYLAAWEFQYAAELMPHKPEPKNNLGMVLEAVGRLDDAAKQYGQAMAAAPDNPEYVGNLTRCRIRQNKRDAETRKLLEELLLKDTRPDWLKWARGELLRMPLAESATATQPALPLPPPTRPPAQ